MAGRLLKLLLFFLVCWGIYSLVLNPFQRRNWHYLSRQLAWGLLLASALAVAGYWLAGR